MYAKARLTISPIDYFAVAPFASFQRHNPESTVCIYFMNSHIHQPDLHSSLLQNRVVWGDDDFPFLLIIAGRDYDVGEEIDLNFYSYLDSSFRTPNADSQLFLDSANILKTLGYVPPNNLQYTNVELYVNFKFDDSAVSQILSPLIRNISFIDFEKYSFLYYLIKYHKL